METTLDKFLGGRLSIAQPKKGFRAGHDSVLVAAAVPALAGGHVLELGAGVGVASLCLAARAGGVRITGVEIDAALVALANENAKRNRLTERVRFIQGDAAAYKGGPFDHVFLNPPFHPDTGQRSPFAARDRATRDEEGAVTAWTNQALDMIAPGGGVTVILRADQIAGLAKAVPAAMLVLPLAPHAGEKPKRAIVRLSRGGPSQTILASFVLHEADGRPAAAAEAVLRHGEALSLASA